MTDNITLTGMPGAGKSTVGVILAKVLSYGFVDTDILIQTDQGKSLQEIVDKTGHINLRRIEEKVILRLNPEKHVIATGGSAVYSEKAMEHLCRISRVVFLRADFNTIVKRISNFDQRGIAKAKKQSFSELYLERQPLYEKYARITIDCDSISQEDVVRKIAEKLQD